MNKNEILAAYHFRHAQKFMTQTFIHNKKKTKLAEKHGKVQVLRRCASCQIPAGFPLS